MFKKLLITTAILTATTGIAVASSSSPYVGVGTGINVVTGSSSVFRGMPLNIFAGYGATVAQNIYLGGELFGTVGTLQVTDNTSGTSSLKTTYGFGASFMPGLILADHTMAYVRMGVVRTRFSNLSSSATGGQVGLGMQTSLAQNWDLRGEYDYTGYNKVRSISPRSDLFTVGLVYKLD